MKFFDLQHKYPNYFEDRVINGKELNILIGN